jgi:sugar phosphate isomerase/epimerase
MNLKVVSGLAALVVLFTSLNTQAGEGVPRVPPPVSGFPIGRCVQVLNVVTPEEAKQVGFEYLELALQNLLPLPDEEFAKQVARIRGIGLPALSGYGFLPGDLRVIGTNVNDVRVDEVVRHCLGRAKQFGITMVVYGNSLAGSRKVPAEISRTAARQQFVGFIRRAAVEAEKHGITILIQPMPRESTDLINSVAEGLEFIEEVNHPHVQMLVDYSRFVQSKEEMEVITRAAKRIRQIEIQNPNGWVYPVSAEESDYAAFFRALKRGGYQGGFSIHGRPGDVFVNGPRAITLLRNLAAEHLSDAGTR